MKKFLMVSGLGLLIVVLVGYFVLTYFLGSIVQRSVNTLGPKVTQTKVELAGATLSPLTGTGTLTGFAVGNPAGWSQGNAFFLGTVHLDVEPSSIFKDTIVINELTIDQPEFLYETRLVSSNIKDLMANIEKYTGRGGNAGDKEGTPKKFIVKKLRFTNGKVTVGIGPTALVVPLPEIKQDDIGTAEGGVSSAQVAAVIARDVLSHVVTAATAAIAEDGGKATLGKAKETAKQIGDAVKDLFKKP